MVRIVPADRPPPASYAGIEVVVEQEEEREGHLDVSVYCPQLERRDQLSFSWGPRRKAQQRPTDQEVEDYIQEEYIPSLGWVTRAGMKGKRLRARS